MIVNPMCDMPWNIYLDYLADQGFDELRQVDIFCLFTPEHDYLSCHGGSNKVNGFGSGEWENGNSQGYIDYYYNYLKGTPFDHFYNIIGDDYNYISHYKGCGGAW